MNIFNQYSQNYDAIYGDKDYTRECNYIKLLCEKFAPEVKISSILDLGCGTGGHAIPFAQMGYSVTGVDRSETMLAQGRVKAQGKALPLSFFFGDLQTLTLHKSFDLVISLFAVFSYQVNNSDLSAAFSTARRHLSPGRLFIFDAWFGPAVLTERPSDRIKEVSQGTNRIIRLAHSTLNVQTNSVCVAYTILQLDENKLIEEFKEDHLMRFLFAPEVEYFAAQAGFQVLNLHPFMVPGRLPSERDWNVTWVLRAV